MVDNQLNSARSDKSKSTISPDKDATQPKKRTWKDYLPLKWTIG